MAKASASGQLPLEVNANPVALSLESTFFKERSIPQFGFAAGHRRFLLGYASLLPSRLAPLRQSGA